jgi:hypothetical protein
LDILRGVNRVWIFLAPIEKALVELGYTERAGPGVVIEGWPVQFLPAASELDEETLDRAVELNIGLTGERPVTARCLRAGILWQLP